MAAILKFLITFKQQTYNLISSFTYEVSTTNFIYCQTSNISDTLVGNKLVDHSDVYRALPINNAPTTSSFSI